MSAYYNENDKLKAATLRVAIEAGAIAPGDVDERSIEVVLASDLVGYTQCHFFAGGGFWSLALRQAGWPDDREVWTGSCPCPSFSAAGKGGGFDDPRHLWPDWAKLIRQRKPATLFGEQSDDAIGYGWLDLVQTDLEAQAYAVGKIVLGACSVGAPHIRQRLYFCAHAANSDRWSGECGAEAGAGANGERRRGLAGSRVAGALRHAASSGVETREPQRISSEPRSKRIAQSGLPGYSADADGGEPGNRDLQRGGEQRLFAQDCGTGDRGDTASAGRQHEQNGHGSGAAGDGPPKPREQPGPGCVSGEPERGDHAIGERLEGHFGDVREWRGPGWLDPLTARSAAEAGATRGYWRDCDWWYGRDGKYRPAGPGIFPLAHGSPARVGRLRMFGDAINVEVAKAFIASTMEVLA